MYLWNGVNAVRVQNMKKRYTIGVAIGNASSPHAKALVRGIWDAAEKMDVNIIFFLGVHMANHYHEYFGESLGNSHDFQYDVVYDYAKLADVDGLIIAFGSLGIFMEDTNQQHFLERFKGIPYVFAEERDERGKGSSVIFDNYQGMYHLVEHLVTVHQYKKFLFLSGSEGSIEGEERERAFYDVLAKYSIPFEAGRRGSGDYSRCCNKEIARLLDTYPDSDAFVCANDVMAESVYEECAVRNLVVGKDIAVTGYDDWEMAEVMTPPLTTVVQNELEMGYACVQSIINLCEGKDNIEMVMPAKLKIRASCGCTVSSSYQFPGVENIEEVTEDSYIERVVECFCEKIMLSHVNEERKKEARDHIYKIIKMNCGVFQDLENYQIDKKIIKQSVNEMLTSACGKYISLTALLEGVNLYLMHLVKMEENSERMICLMELGGVLSQCIQSSIVKEANERDAYYDQDTILIPLISRDMLSHIDDERVFYEVSMKVLSVLQVKSAYLYILENPVSHSYGERWNCPETIYLTSCFRDGEIISFEPNKRPQITMENGMISIIDNNRRNSFLGLNLFQGKHQYGFLLVEMDPSEMMVMHLAGMQIAYSLNIFHMFQRQLLTQQQLEALIDEVSDKNRILGYISGYDEMTGTLNRRGFMEKAIEFINMNEYNRAILLIADLDHLKEINDCFGHTAGDFAIQSTAQVLFEALGEDALLARIGGDEFVAMLSYESFLSGDSYIRRLQRAFADFNKMCQKDFYVEISAGYTVFVCEKGLGLEAILDDSDKMLYEAKKLRRASVKKTSCS